MQFIGEEFYVKGQKRIHGEEELYVKRGIEERKESRFLVVKKSMKK